MSAPVPTITLNDGRAIPQLGFGVWQVSTEDIVPAVAKALDVGYRHIDTAAIYGNEEGVGQAIRESGIPRDELFVTTKLWNDRQGEARIALEESLGKLGLDYVDLYLIHWPVPGQDLRVSAYREMEQAQQDGLTRSIGVSNFRISDLDEIARECTVTPAVNQIELHPTFAQHELVAANIRHGIATEAWSPLGQSQDLQNPAIREIAERLGRTPAQVIIRWHLQSGRIVFPKSITPNRIEENFGIFDFALSDVDLAAIAAVDTGTRIGGDPETLGTK